MGEPIYVFKQQVRDLAANIYVGLIGQAVGVSDNAVKMTTSAENLAKLSFKLAQAFQVVEEELNSANLPKNPSFKLEAADIAEWAK